MVRLCVALCSALIQVGSSLRVVKVATATNSEMSEVLAANFSSLAAKVMNPENAGGILALGSHLEKLGQDINLESAIKAVEHKVPASVATLLQEHRAGYTPHTVEGLKPESFDKARIALNELVEKAWEELDDKIIKCKGFEDMNRENYHQTHRDLMRLIEQVNDLERLESEAIENIGSTDQMIHDVEDQLEQATKEYNKERAEDDQEMAIRNSDLDVFAFILKFTKCEDATSLVQVCELQSGRRTLRFKDAATNKEYSKMMQSSPKNRNSIDQLLRLLQTEHEQQPKITIPINPEPVVGMDDMPCSSGSTGGEDGCMKTCSPDGTPDCALLHDKLSLMWGNYKDKVDELTMDMMRKQNEFYELKANLNDQIQILAKKKGTMNQLLAEARSNMAADRGEAKEKQANMRVLDRQYRRYMKKCQRRISWILYQDMCAIKVVRNAVLATATSCPTDEIQDCDVDAWVPEECSVPCDDKCDPAKPFKCGGWQKMKRRVVVPNDDCGIKCPVTEKYKRCGQYKCPVDCVMSAWSGWSKCTAECEGGVQSKTRSILVKTKHGGMACNTAEESQPCNTQSCDRDCSLAAWTDYSPCSVACGGGFQEKFRHVAIPIRGDGKCPSQSSRFRYHTRRCNKFDCNGDEICVAKQDLIIAVDGSGSVRDKGWTVMKDFVVKLLERYEAQYWGAEAVQIGIVQFGNGVLGDDGRTVSPAKSIHGLTLEHDKVLEAVNGMNFKKGFTNMAQAFSMAEDMLSKRSRKEAQHSVMVITDGQPSFSFMTSEMVEQLDDKGIMRYFFVITTDGGKSETMQLVKSWASQPWRTNVVRVPGMRILEADLSLWVEKAVTKFCPNAYSPAVGKWEENSYGYAHIKNFGYCGGRGKLLSRNANTEECAALAVKDGAAAFIKGIWWRHNWCWASDMAYADVKSHYEEKWKDDRHWPLCDIAGGHSWWGGWRFNWFSQFYAIIPIDE